MLFSTNQTKFRQKSLSKEPFSDSVHKITIHKQTVLNISVSDQFSASTSKWKVFKSVKTLKIAGNTIKKEELKLQDEV